ncbi:MAG: polyprenyl synthetase family protein [Deltaproteobacteria bacterium]|nr:polyprenyl synthetase family protein [Deltaproteobacteria bacterium]MBW2303584.1 polyprenyl synthetase family protein [Deltaproteobacteria bacterium]
MNSSQTLLDRFEPYFEKINQALAGILTSPVELVNEIGRHSLLGQGKRVRPLLFVLSSRLCGSPDTEEMYRISTVFECIHTGSLLHDDVLDNAETRRNKPAARQVWGNHASVLGGDYLYTKALELALTTGNTEFLRVLNQMSLEMVEGQMLELANTDNWDIGREDYMRIITSKTAVLMSAASASGGVLAGAEKKVVERLRSFGLNLGIAFQLVDDVLDYTSCEEVFGKPVGKDLREGKITLPLIYTLCALDRAENERIKSLFQSEKVAEEDLESLISMVREGEAIGRVQAEAREYMRKAAVSLDPFPDSPMKQDLLALNAYLCERRF